MRRVYSIPTPYSQGSTAISVQHIGVLVEQSQYTLKLKTPPQRKTRLRSQNQDKTGRPRAPPRRSTADEDDEEERAPSHKRFGFVQTLDTQSKRRLYEVLHSQDLQMNQEITFLSDGDDTLRQLQLEMSPKAIHLLDWHHVTMRLTVLGQFGNGLVQCEAVLGEVIRDKIERLKWSLWHGQVDKALGKIDDLETSIEPFSETYARYAGLVKALSKLRTYIVNNRHLIPNYGERYRNGEPIATGFVESTVNEVVSKRFCKKQQMAWSKEGAHLLLQTRVRVLNGELAGIFKRWYPELDIKAEAIPIAA